MADYYIQFSTTVKMSARMKEMLRIVKSSAAAYEDDPEGFEARWGIQKIDDWEHTREMIMEFPEPEEDEDFWDLINDGTDGPDLATTLVVATAVMKGCPSEPPIIIHWSETCSRPRFDAFGGGVAVIDHSGCRAISTWDLATLSVDQLAQVWDIINKK